MIDGKNFSWNQNSKKDIELMTRGKENTKRLLAARIAKALDNNLSSN